MKLLDLFCGAGGASMGYYHAGFKITGIDNRPRSYPFEFIEMDAFEALTKYGKYFDVIHASPPCQGYSKTNYSRDSKFTSNRGKNEPRLIEPLRKELEILGKPYVIENVIGAREEMKNPQLLCGRMFNLPIPRHRLFETNWYLKIPEHPKCRGYAKQYALENDIVSGYASFG